MPNISDPACPICAAPARYDFSGRDIMFHLYERYDYYRCTACAAVFMHPMPTLEEIAGFYPPTYSVFDESARVRRISGLKQAILKRKHGYAHLSPGGVFEFLTPLASRLYKLYIPHFVPGGKMLDVGCGNGRYLSTMRTLGWDVQGVEFSDEGVRVCRAAELPVHHGDLASAAFPDNTFDLVTVRHVIEHIAEPQPFMAELARVLKPGGRLVIETPNGLALGRALMGASWFANDVPRHLVLFNPDSLGRLAAQHGLHQVDVTLETTPKIILNSIDYALENQGKGSSRRRGRRFLARIYVWLAQRCNRGDTIHVTFTK